MPLLDGAVLEEFVIDETDPYHPNHPLHHLILEELDDYDEAFKLMGIPPK